MEKAGISNSKNLSAAKCDNSLPYITAATPFFANSSAVLAPPPLPSSRNTTSPFFSPYFLSVSNIASRLKDFIIFILFPPFTSLFPFPFSLSVIFLSSAFSSSLAFTSSLSLSISLSLFLISSASSISLFLSDRIESSFCAKLPISSSFSSSLSFRAVVSPSSISICSALPFIILRNLRIFSLSPSSPPFFSSCFSSFVAFFFSSLALINLFIAALMDTPRTTNAFTSSTSTPVGVFFCT